MEFMGGQSIFNSTVIYTGTMATEMQCCWGGGVEGSLGVCILPLVHGMLFITGFRVA